MTVAVAGSGTEAVHPGSVLLLLLTHFFLGKIKVECHKLCLPDTNFKRASVLAELQYFEILYYGAKPLFFVLSLIPQSSVLFQTVY